MEFNWLFAVMSPLILIGAGYYLKFAIPQLIKSSLDKELESYKTVLTESLRHKELLSGKIINEFEQVLVEIGELETYSFGCRLGIIRQEDSEYIKQRFYSLARFAATYWPYFECDLRQSVQDFILDVERCGVYDATTNTTTFDGNSLKAACDKLQLIVKSELDSLYRKGS